MRLGYVLIASSFATPALAQARRPHLELDMTSQEYRELLQGRDELEGTDELDPILDAGKRLLQWIEVVNAQRDPAAKLQLSTPATQRGYPIDQPTFSNRTIIKTDWTALKASLPEIFKKTLFEGGDLVRDLPISDELFIEQARLVDRLYQRASRWLLEEPWLDEYAAIAREDVRGYYYLDATPGLEGVLKGWKNLPQDRKAQLKGWLLQQCGNSEENAACATQFDQAIATNANPWSFHTKYVAAAKAHWDSYFSIPEFRTDVTWTGADVNRMGVPFRDPQNEPVKAWLKDNIEDEWKWGAWQLKLDFEPTGDDDMTHLKFVAGATPHVNAIAGSEITMDGNRNIAEYTARWTIRHEYGHVLGFPDCYLEFYDAPNGVMVQYQLDITNLMCARTGHLQQKHYDELKRVYFRE